MPPKRMVLPMKRGIIKLGKVPSQSTSKLVLGFYAHGNPWGQAFLKIKPMLNSTSHGFYWPYLSRRGYCVGWKEVQQASLGWKLNEKRIKLPNAENDKRCVSWCVGFLFCGCGCCVVCSKLIGSKVVWWKLVLWRSTQWIGFVLMFFFFLEMVG
jgi:hypothetical protein